MDPRYKRRATLRFGPNTQGGRDPVAVEDGRAVFWKGNPNDIRYDEPVECVVADSQYVSFALPAFAPDEEAEPPSKPAAQPDHKPPPLSDGGPGATRTKTGLKRTQLTAVKDAAEKRARKVAKAEVRAVAGAIAGLEKARRETGTQLDALQAANQASAVDAASARETVASFKKAFDDLASRIASAEGDLRALKAASRAALGAIPKPEPADPSKPTDEEIQRQIVYQLHQMKCYGGKHTSGEHFRTGYHAKVPQKRIDAAIKALYGKGILRRHAKTPEQYSLNAEAKPLIAALLGVPDRDIDTDEAGATSAPPRTSGSNSAAASRDDDRFVERGNFDNTVRALRERVESTERAQREALSSSMTKDEAERMSAELASLREALDSSLKALAQQGRELERLRGEVDAWSPTSGPRAEAAPAPRADGTGTLSAEDRDL